MEEDPKKYRKELQAYLKDQKEHHGLRYMHITVDPFAKDTDLEQVAKEALQLIKSEGTPYKEALPEEYH